MTVTVRRWKDGAVGFGKHSFEARAPRATAHYLRRIGVGGGEELGPKGSGVLADFRARGVKVQSKLQHVGE